MRTHTDLNYPKAVIAPLWRKHLKQQLSDTIQRPRGINNQARFASAEA